MSPGEANAVTFSAFFMDRASDEPVAIAARFPRFVKASRQFTQLQIINAAV
jgi:hypothetical protein